MNYLNKFLSPFGVRFHKSKSLENEKLFYKGRIRHMSNFYVKSLLSYQRHFNNEITGVIFSKDRAMQLQALLASYFYHTVNPAPLFILYTYSDTKHKESYNLLQEEFKDYQLTFIKETDFHLQLKAIITNLTADRIFFMTDDAIFLDNYDLHYCFQFDPLSTIFSLRLGCDLDYCYAYDRRQTVPECRDFNAKNNGLITWTWEFMRGSPDWNYPLSVDATIFFRREIQMIIEELEFTSPNSLEAQMQLFKELFLYRKGACFSKVKYVNIPCNIVQNEFNNRFNHSYTTDQLLELFMNGQRINWKKYQGVKAAEAAKSKFTFLNKVEV